jgi:hypothetical protein
MRETFADKLTFVLKALSVGRGSLAARMGVDKSAVGRWVTGVVAPSLHNLERLTALVAERVEGFTLLDWEKDLAGLADLVGVDPPDGSIAPVRFGDGLPLPILEHSRITTELRGRTYEGIFRSTRPFAQRPGYFIHDTIMIRADPNGLLRVRMSTGGVAVEGWLLLLQNQLFCIAAELSSGGLVFAVLNGVNTLHARVLDGLVLSCALDPGRTPTATAAVYERIADLGGDPDADDLRFETLALGACVSESGALPEDIRTHLARDVGPAQLALGGDWLLRAPLDRTISRGLDPT